MYVIRMTASIVLFIGSLAAAAQAGPYSGQEQRDIKAMSAEETQQYLQGRGMGLAKAAELNHYPGPAHVLELAEGLQLTQDQRVQTQRIHGAMERDAKAAGRMLIDKERELDALFSSGRADAWNVRVLLQEIARLQGEVRLAHLLAHIQQKAILTARQVAAYDELRGYSIGHASASPRNSHRH